MSPQQLEIILIAPEPRAEEIAKSVELGGGTADLRGMWSPENDRLADLTEQGDTMDPLMAIGLIVATGWLIKRISDTLSDHLHPESQIVDMRSTPPILLVARHIKPPGTLIVLKTVDGQHKEERYTPDRRDEALTFLGGVFG